MDLKAKIAEAANKWKQAQDIIKEYSGEEMPEDVKSQVDALLDEAESIKNKVDAENTKRSEQKKREGRAQDMEDYFTKGTPPSGLWHPGNTDEEISDEEINAKAMNEIQKKAQLAYLRGGPEYLTPEQKQQLSSLRDPEGGYVVLEDFRLQFIQALENATHIRERATVISTSNATVGFPTFDYEGDAEWTAESGEIAEEEFTDLLGKKTFRPSKLARIFRLPIELSEDAAVDIETMLINHFARRFGVIQENAFINGDGVEKPYGLLNAPNMNVVNITAADFDGAAQDDEIVTDALVDMIYAIRAVYRGDGAWLLNRQMIRKVRKLRDDNGQFLWQMGLQPGEPNVILSYPCTESEFMPFGTTPADVAGIFGDFSYYWIVDRVDLMVQRLIEKYAEFDQVGFKLRTRVDAAPVLGEPFARLVIT